MIPEYFDCINNKEACDYFFHEECPETCELYQELGIGAMCSEDIGRLEREIENDS